MHHPVSVYAKQVTQGKLHDQCCPYEIAACQRHLDDLKRQGTKDFPYVFDTTRADRIIRWFGQCIQVRGVEQREPIQLQPWQVFDLGCTYGWVHKDTGAGASSAPTISALAATSKVPRNPDRPSTICAATLCIRRTIRNWRCLSRSRR